MPSEFKRENRYVVLKIKDIEEALSGDAQQTLSNLCSKVACYRQIKGKPTLQCVVVESDWPEYEAVWGLLENRFLKSAEESQELPESSQESPHTAVHVIEQTCCLLTDFTRGTTNLSSYSATFRMSHNNGTTTLEQELILDRAEKGWTAEMDMSDFSPQLTATRAAHKLADWMERMAIAIRSSEFDKVEL